MASATVAESISRPAVLYPTEVTCTPRLRNTLHTTGVGEWVAAQTMSAWSHAWE
jgi:UDP-glucose 4-epimerase